MLAKPFKIEEILDLLNLVLPVKSNPDAVRIYLGSERQDLDYKEGLDLQTKDNCAALAKDVIAIANWGGGTIIVGVAEPRPTLLLGAAGAHPLAASLSAGEASSFVRSGFTLWGAQIQKMYSFWTLRIRTPAQVRLPAPWKVAAGFASPRAAVCIYPALDVDHPAIT